MRISGISRLKRRKNLLFVNKKKQKNFVNLACCQSDKSFLLLFFKKEDFSFTFH